MSVVVERTMEDRARVMREAGVGPTAIARELGVSTNTIHRWLNPRYAETSRQSTIRSKRRRTGTCEGCGEATTYNGRTVNGASRRCPGCAAIANGEALRGCGPVQLAVGEFCREPRRFTEIRDHFGWPGTQTGARITGLLKTGVLSRVSRGVYIATSSLDRTPDAETSEAVSPPIGTAS